jgi:hypothetical protein
MVRLPMNTARNTLAFVGGFRRPRDNQPHGTLHAAYQMSHALARHGGYAALHVYQEGARHELVLPEAPPITVFQKPELRRSREPYHAIYVANGEQRSSAPHLLRPHDDWAPVICTVGTAHSNGQWMHWMVALASGAVRPTDGFVFKSQAALSLVRSIWSDWSSRLTLPEVFPAATVIANGVDVAANRRVPRLRAEMRGRLRLADDDVAFLAFSRLSPATKGDPANVQAPPPPPPPVQFEEAPASVDGIDFTISHRPMFNALDGMDGPPPSSSQDDVPSTNGGVPAPILDDEPTGGVPAPILDDNPSVPILDDGPVGGPSTVPILDDDEGTGGPDGPSGSDGPSVPIIDDEPEPPDNSGDDIGPVKPRPNPPILD